MPTVEVDSTAAAQPAAAAGAPQTLHAQQRYVSLDAYRGLIMSLLVSVGFGFGAYKGHPILGAIANHVDHVAWEGCVFWDLIQPAFMFMVGVAMPFALARRIAQGATFRQNLWHVFSRSFKLFALAQIFTIWSSGRVHIGLINVLDQIAFTYLFCFLIMQLEFRWQVVTAFLILAGHWALFAIFPGPEGAFSKTGNVGAVIDQWVFGKPYSGYYVTINFISSTVTTLFGVWAGYLLRSPIRPVVRVWMLGIAAVAGLLGGLALSPFNPMVKRIWTASFTLYSAGWVLLGLMIFVWLVDIKGYRKVVFPLLVVGSNSIFVYVIFQLFRGSIDRSVAALTGRYTFIGLMAPVAQSVTTFLVIWYFCYWLYKRKIFIKV